MYWDFPTRLLPPGYRPSAPKWGLYGGPPKTSGKKFVVLKKPETSPKLFKPATKKYNEVVKLIFILSLIFALPLGANVVYVGPFEPETKTTNNPPELGLVLGACLAEGLSADGQEGRGPQEIAYTLAVMGYDPVTGFKRKGWPGELLATVRAFAPQSLLVTGSYRLKAGQLTVTADLWDVDVGTLLASATNTAAYPNEVMPLVGDLSSALARPLPPSRPDVLALAPAVFRQPLRYKAVQAYGEALGAKLQGRLEGSNGALAAAALSTAADPYYLPAVHLSLDLLAERSQGRERDGYEDPVSNLESQFAAGLAVLKAAPGHAGLNRSLAALTMAMNLEAVSWSFLQAADRGEHDAEQERLLVRYARRFPTRFGGEEGVYRLEMESQKRIARTGEKDMWYWIDQGRLHRMTGSRAHRAGLAASAKRSYNNASTALKTALGLAPENPWVFAALAEFFMDPDNVYTPGAKTKSLDVSMNAIRFSYERIPAILYVSAKAFLANGERSRAFWALSKVLALSQRADYKAALEQFQKKGTLP